MPRGQPDFGMYAPETHIAGLSDMSELAVRLGSINIFDRRGKVVDMDDFEEPVIRWNRLGDAVIEIEHSSYAAKSGGQSVKLRPPIGAGKHAYIYKAYPSLPSKRNGIEICLSTGAVDSFFYAYMIRYTGAVRYTAQVILDFELNTLSYLDKNNVEQVIADNLSLNRSAFTFHPLKLVADFDTNKYVRVFFEDTFYDLSSYDLRLDDPDPTRACQAAFFEVILKSGAQEAYYLDDFILTMDEP